MLTEAPVLEGGARAGAAEFLAAPRKLGAVILRAGDLRQHADRLDGENLHLVAAIIGLAACEHFLTRKLSQSVDVETEPTFAFHSGGCSSGSVLIKRSASSSVTDA